MTQKFPSDEVKVRSSSAFLIFTNILTERVLQQIAAANEELAGRCDVHVIGYFPDAIKAPAPFRSDARFHAYDRDQMEAMGYPVKGRPFQLMPGNTDMPVLAFVRNNPHYDTFWLFENDVVFTGPLLNLIGAFSDSPADLVTTNIAPPPNDWPHLPMNVFPLGWPTDLPGLRAFHPVFRASRRFLTEVDRFYRDGGNGHYEYSWTYVAKALGLELEDFGGRGQYVRHGNRNRFYTSTPQTLHLYPGTFRFRPAMRRAGRRPMKLWHPIKDDFDLSILTEVKEHIRLTRRWLLPIRWTRWLKPFHRRKP